MYVLIFFVCCLLSFSCMSDTRRAVNEYNRWINTTIELPENIVFVRDIFDTVSVKLDSPLKIFSYNDSSGCLNCNLSLSRWKSFINEIMSLSGDKVTFVQVVSVTNMLTLKDVIYGSMFHYPLCIDKIDTINKLNHFSDDYNYRTFLLDEDNRVVLIGNPVQNLKIKDLYIRTICERLGYEYIPNPDDNPRISVGTIQKTVPKNVCFVIRNTDDATMQIDTIFTSCECATAKINKMRIMTNETAILLVTYTPDNTGDFVKDVFVKVKGNDQPKIYTIEGIVK